MAEPPVATKRPPVLPDTGERTIPPAEGEVSVVYAFHRFAYAFAQGYADGAAVLDVGCGTGYGSQMLAGRARRVLALDYDADAVAYAREHYPAPNLAYAVAEANALDAEAVGEEPYDLAVSFQVIEHLPDPGGFLDRLKKLVRPGGTILLTTPNVKRPATERHENPLHCSEMSHDEFRALLAGRLARFELLGVGYARPSLLRRLAGRLPFYHWLGLALKRSGAVKKAAVGALGLTQLRVVRDGVAREAVDLLAVCRNDG